jgi:hypothetical protein
VGRCFSYANYEASTRQFRIRAARGNAFVVSEYADSWALQTGTYIVKQGDLPLYKIDLCAPGRVELCVVPMKAGAVTGQTRIDAPRNAS